MCCIVLYCAVLCCAVLCCAVLCCAVLYCTVLYCAVLHCTVLCCAVLCCTVLCCALLCCAAHLKSYPLFRVTYCTCLLMPRNSEILPSTLSTLLYLVDTSADFLPLLYYALFPIFQFFYFSSFLVFSSYLISTESLLKFCSFSYHLISSHLITHILPQVLSSPPSPLNHF